MKIEGKKEEIFQMAGTHKQCRLQTIENNLKKDNFDKMGNIFIF